jgi:hypothetical protein
MKLLFLLSFSLGAFAFDHDHSKFNEILSSFTTVKDKQTSVYYEEIKKNDKALDSYLNELETLKRSQFKAFSKDERLAFWINAYNAYTIKLIVDNYPVKSIKDIGGWFGSPWKKKFINIFGKKISLDGIEHDIIRKKFNEPRIHFAVNCASVGCPSILPVAFVASKLDIQLDKAAKNFLSNPIKNKYNSETNTLHLSKIFAWYGGDFEKKHGSYLNYVKKYITFPADASKEWLSYDWNLNEAKK